MRTQARSTTEPTHRQMRTAAELLRILAHPTRLAILRELSRGPKCVTDIRDLLEVPQANVSQHLSALRREELVDYHEDGKLRCYYISRPRLVDGLFVLIDADHPAVLLSAAKVRRDAKKRACGIASDNGTRRGRSSARRSTHQ